MPMDSIAMCSNTFYMSNIDAGSSLRWLSASMKKSSIGGKQYLDYF